MHGQPNIKILILRLFQWKTFQESVNIAKKKVTKM